MKWGLLLETVCRGSACRIYTAAYGRLQELEGLSFRGKGFKLLTLGPTRMQQKTKTKLLERSMFKKFTFERLAYFC